MADVAKAAGVSVMTVSYAYAQPSRVSAESHAAVRESAERLGYPGPHPGARSLRRGRTGNLGVVLGEHLTYAFDDPQAARFLAGVAQVCADRASGLTLLPVTGAASDVDRVAEAAVDGFVVWTSADDDPVVDAVASTGLPAVVHGGPHREDMSFVSIDNRAAAQVVASAAFAGARRPAVLSFPLERSRAPGVQLGTDPSAATFRVTRERLAGFRDAWCATGGDWDSVTVAVCATNSASEAEAVATELVGGPHPCDAIVAMSDELALGFLACAAQLGLTVPDDFRLTGWDDTQAAAAAGLTTVRQSLRDQGMLCARTVLGRATDDGEGGRGLTLSAWRLVARTSAPTS